MSLGESPEKSTQARFELQVERILGLVRHDRWLVGGLRDGRLRVVADSSPEPERPFCRVRPLSALARRCLHERRPLAVSSLAPETSQLSGGDWELEWPALVYAPVGYPGRRPAGLLVVGCARPHWYPQEDLDYLSALAVTLTPGLLSLEGPIARLSPTERLAARLLGQGLSLPEIEAALKVDHWRAREIVGGALRKLSLRSPRQLPELWPELAPLYR